MGHNVIPDREHYLLQQRLDRMVNGAPDSPHLVQILALLFTPEEAQIARHLPAKPLPLKKIVRRTGMAADELEKRLIDMAHRGLVLDFIKDEQRYFLLPPVVTGLFEFVFMRARDDLPVEELTKLFEAYMFQDDRFANSLFAGNTQIGRVLPHEEMLVQQDHSEVLDWERATHLIKQASTIAVAQCACRHMKMHQDKACDAPMETCYSFNQTAESLSRNGIARTIDTSEALAILEISKEAGLAQIGDNVQRDMIYMCNCCGCCCAMFHAIRTFDMPKAVVAANWVMKVDAEKCRACGKCVKACPVNAITTATTTEKADTEKQPVICDQEVCIGCGVCSRACAFDAITMLPREKRVVPPETTFDRVALMALERGKLTDLIFDEPENIGYKAIGRVLALIEKTPPAKALLAIKPLRSAFLETFVREAKKISDIF